MALSAVTHSMGVSQGPPPSLLTPRTGAGGWWSAPAGSGLRNPSSALRPVPRGRHARVKLDSTTGAQSGRGPREGPSRKPLRPQPHFRRLLLRALTGAGLFRNQLFVSTPGLRLALLAAAAAAPRRRIL